MAYRIALVGNPNCGKTTLFNLLTGSSLQVGNWPGVTVEKKEGRLPLEHGEGTLLDLPGIYSLTPYSLEERITRDYLLQERPDLILNIVDGTNLERNLFLTAQLMDLERPMVLAVNMMDEVSAQGLDWNLPQLETALSLPVVGISARLGEGIPQLLQVIQEVLQGGRTSRPKTSYNYATEAALTGIGQILQASGCGAQVPLRFSSGRLLERDPELARELHLSQERQDQLEQVAQAYESTSAYADRETMLSDARYRWIGRVLSQAGQKSTTPQAPKHRRSDRVDDVVIHPLLAIPLFFLVMFAVFFITFGPIGSHLKEAMESLLQEDLAAFLGALLTRWNAPAWLRSLLLEAILGGVGSVLAFLPQIALLFLFLSLLEDSGYLARAAFLMDRPLRKIGLTGASFIPMLMGFGCSVPAMMAARGMANERDQRLTVLLIPFLSCGARLPLYGLFATLFFPEHAGLVVFLLYLLGLAAAICTGLLLKDSFYTRTDPASFVMELPPYRLPTPAVIWKHLWIKCEGFLVKAGTTIFVMSLLVWLLQHLTPHFTWTESLTQSLFALWGRELAPLFAPLGFGFWQAAMALCAGVVAKEAMVSTFQLVYGGAGAALAIGLSGAFTPASAAAFLVFALLYVPCISTLTTMARELGGIRWPIISALLHFAWAYGISFLVYLLGNLVL